MRRLLLLGAMIALLLGLPSAAHAQQSTAPTVSSVAITSNPGSDGTYGTGDIITVSLTFSEPVTLNTTYGTPYVVLTRIHRRRASGQRPEAAKGCSSESGIMVL